MKVKQIVLEAFKPLLEPLGFVYRNNPRDSLAWEFVRNCQEHEQCIAVVKSRFETNSVQLQLRTSVDAGISSGLLDPATHTRGWRYYADEPSFRLVIKELAELAVAKGILWLEECGGPYPVPPEEMGRLLLNDPQVLAAEIMNEFGLSTKHPGDLLRLEEHVLQLRRDGNAIDWPFLMRVSAFVGEALRHAYGGEWIWDSRRAGPALVQLGGRLTDYPFHGVANLWFKPDGRHSLKAGFDFIARALDQ